MRDLTKMDKRVMWLRNHPLQVYGIRCAIMDLPSGMRCALVVGENEEGWEHVSVELSARRLPTWEEMCFIKDIFWDEEEMVVQIHPKQSEYVDITEALHLWRPKNGDWSKLNGGIFEDNEIRDHGLESRKKGGKKND